MYVCVHALNFLAHARLILLDQGSVENYHLKNGTKYSAKSRWFSLSKPQREKKYPKTFLCHIPTYTLCRLTSLASTI